ncbi:S1 family peptidase [Streptomyces sp. E11-3]|uniref:S1 family peptidase n=1 Tax=Streptomyces sp. E11-3 TaxID=3110112 RepID=UPI0039813A20
MSVPVDERLDRLRGELDEHTRIADHLGMDLERPLPAIPKVARRIAVASSAALAVVPAVPATAANDPAAPFQDPGPVVALAAELGDDGTGGVYYDKDGHLILTVTDRAAARTAQVNGGATKLVQRSTAELKAVVSDLDELEDMPNTAWGIDPATNQVSVDIFSGAPADAQERIEKATAGDPGAVRIDRFEGKIETTATSLRGGNGIRSSGVNCSAGFNTKDSKGRIYTLTAGHCVPGTGNLWSMAWNSATIGTQTSYGHGGWNGDWAAIRANWSGIKPLGTVRYHGGIYKQIDRSRYPVAGEPIHRIGAVSQDKTGYITKEVVTITNNKGVQMRGMFESNVCAKKGDSGGPALRGTTALGIQSAIGNSPKTCTSSTTGSYQSYFTPVQRVLDDKGLRVY